jgi:hypothetical protein
VTVTTPVSQPQDFCCVGKTHTTMLRFASSSGTTLTTYFKFHPEQQSIRPETVASVPRIIIIIIDAPMRRSHLEERKNDAMVTLHCFIIMYALFVDVNFGFVYCNVRYYLLLSVETKVRFCQ